MPDGTVIQGVPEGITKSQLMAKYGKLQPQPQQDEEPLVTTTAGRTAFDQGMQGATFNLADEPSDLLGAIGAKTSDLFRENKIFEGQGVGDIYFDARDATKERLARQMQERPVLSVASQVGGGLFTGIAGGTTKAGQAVANSVRTGLLPNATSVLGRAGNLATKIGQGAAIGGASSGLAGFGGADEGERLQGAESGATVGALIGGAIPAAGAAVGKLRGTPAASSEEIRNLSRQAYQSAAQKGGVLTPIVTDRFVADVNKLNPQTAAGKMLSGESPFTKLTEKITQLKGQHLTLDAAQEIDEFLGDTVDEFTDSLTGKVTKQGKKILDIQDAFRRNIESASAAEVQGGKAGFESLKEARSLWSKSAKLRDIEKIITRADMMDNPATGIKTGFRTLYNSGRINGYSDAEKKLIKKAAETGIISDTLRTFGSRLIPAITAASGGGLGGTVASQAASMASRNAASRLQVGRAAKVASKIAGPSQAHAQKAIPYGKVATRIQNLGRP